MKADHRHELKTNELADWMTHLPQWAQQNRTTLVAAAAVVVVAIIVYFWSYYRTNVVAVRNQQRLTTLLSSVPAKVNEVMRASMQGTDQSYALQDIQNDLQEFAGDVSNDNMAALALIKRAETIRAELHLRQGNVSRDDLTKLIGSAQASYQEALDRTPSNPGLAAAAQFGLGLCEEELGNFDKAAEIYRTVAQKPEYAGTVARAAAGYRLEIMGDFKSPVVFAPAPPKPQPAPAASAPTIQIPGNAGGQTLAPAPEVPMIGPVGPGAPTEAAPTPVETNQPAGG